MMFLNNLGNVKSLNYGSLTVTYDVFKCIRYNYHENTKCCLTVTYDVFKLHCSKTYIILFV